MTPTTSLPKQATCVPTLVGVGGCYCGRRGLPREWVQQMYTAYQGGLTLEAVGRIYGRSRQVMYQIFKRHGLRLRAKSFLPAVRCFGLKFTEQKTQGRHRYLRATNRRNGTLYLHHLIWERKHGPIPPGYKLAFRDGNHRNCRLSNLELLTNSEQVRKYASKGQNHATKYADAQLALLLQGRGEEVARFTTPAKS